MSMKVSRGRHAVGMIGAGQDDALISRLVIRRLARANHDAEKPYI